MKSAGLLDPPLKKLLFNALLVTPFAACCGPNLVMSSVLDVSAPALLYFALAIIICYEIAILKQNDIYEDKTQ